MRGLIYRCGKVFEIKVLGFLACLGHVSLLYIMFDF